MHVGIDQAGQQRAAAQVDRLGARRVFHRRAYFDDALPFHQDFAGSQKLTAFHVHQTGRVQYHRAWLRGGGRQA